jgi:hypothetical protein
MLKPFKAYGSLYVTQGLTLKNSTLLSHVICVFRMELGTNMQILPYTTLKYWYL